MGVVGALTWAYLVDDAFLVARYARNLADGGGWALNPGQPSDGVTAPLWLLPLALGETLGLSAPDLQRVLGLAATALAAWITVRDRPSPVVALLLVVQPTLGIWGGAGLETGLATLALTLLARPLWSREASGVWASIGAFALPWLRPELVVAGGLGAFALALGRPDDAWREERPPRRGPVFALVAGVIGVGLFRVLLFGHLFPLASSAKLGAPLDGLRYTGVAVLMITGVAGAILAAYASRSTGEEGSPLHSRALLAMLGAHVLAVAIAGGDWMPGHRLVMPVIPLYAVLAAAGFERTDHGARRLALGLAVAVPLGAAALQIPAAVDAGALRRARGPVVAAAIRDRGPVALVDAGYLPWLTGVEVIDLGGLTDPVIARAPGGHLGKRVPLGHLVAREPQTLLLHSAQPPRVDDEGRLLAFAGYPVERHLAALPWVRAHFRVGAVVEYAPGYVYVRLDRVSDPVGGSSRSGPAHPPAGD